MERGTDTTSSPAYPRGTVAFLFTDIEGSTSRWERDAPAMWSAVERHFALLRHAVATEGGVLFKTVGDAAQAAFPTVPAAAAAAIAAQQALSAADFGAAGALRVRMAIHVGEATPVEGDYLAPVLNRLARVLGAGWGEQVLLTEAAQALASAALPPGYALRDLGAHRLKDLLVAEHVYQLTGPDLPEQFPPLKSLDSRPNNLPAQPSELIGREAELERLRTLLTAPEARLVTLTGPGGTGKSRLAAQAGADLLDAFPDGVWWIPLAALTDPALVPAAIATPIGLREQPGEALIDTLAGHLRARKTLLILDNLEHLLAAAPAIAGLLESAPGLVVLTTSRAPLRLRGEREAPVEPLILPPADVRLAPDDALAFPAVRLFVARAQAVKPHFALTAETTADVAAICRRLDGLPLAIELAAARIRLLPPAALLGRLEKRLPLLTGGARDLPERQQTLRATIDWSYDLLAEGERGLFARLAVFAGGCTLEAAEAVAGDSAGVDLFDGLEGLVEKSLLRQGADPNAEPRFSMLETIREFALEQLAARPADEAAARAAHAAYYRALLDTLLDADDQVAGYDELETESGNLRAVLDWHERQGDGLAVLELAKDLSWFWWVRGHLREGQTRLESALGKSAAAPPELRAKALSGLGVLLDASGDYARAKRVHEEALALSRQVRDDEGIAEALENLGIIATSEGDLERAAALRAEVLALRRASGDKRGIAVSLINLGHLAFLQGDVERAIAALSEARELSLATGDRWILARSLGNLGGILNWKARAETGGGSPAEDAATGLEAQSMALLKEALAISRELGDREGILDGLTTLGAIAVTADPVHAATLFAAAAALATAEGYQLQPPDPDHHQRLVQSAQEALGPTAFATAWQAGERMTLQEAIATALGSG